MTSPASHPEPTPAPDETPSGHIIVCGLGHVGYRIARTFVRLGERGTIIAQQVRKDWQAAVAPRFNVIQGDAREDEMLLAAGIERARAVLAVTNDDLANVSIALDALRLNPEIAVTVRIFDQILAAHLEKSARISRALSTSALAAPAFIAAALGGSVCGTFETDDGCWYLEMEDVAADETAPRSVGACAGNDGRTPIALERGDEFTIRPAADMAVSPGDRLTFLAPGPRENGLLAAVSPCRRRARRSQFKAVLAGIAEWWGEVPLALRGTLFALLAIVLGSVLLFRLAFKIPIIDAFYFVVSTITTVGYGDYNLHEASPWLKLYGCFLMLCGAAILAVVVSIVTDLVLQTRLRDLIARGSARAKGHIIVAGLGNIGFRLVQGLLHSGEQIVAVERREEGEFVQTTRELAPVVLGNAKMEETLRKAGAAGAKAILAVTDDDLANLSIALAAKRARPDCRVVARIFDSTLAEKIERALGVDAVLSVSGAAAPAFIGSVLCPDVLQGVVLKDCLLLIFQRTIAAGAGLAENEAALWIRPAEAAEFRPATADGRLCPGDRVIGVWWRRFVGGC